MIKKWWSGMNYIENILLYCIKQLNGERTVYSIYHLLNGKKSSQTIQDAHLFSLKKYFGILESLSRESFEEIFGQLIDKNWVIATGEQKYLLSLKGEAFLHDQSLPSYLDGWKYQQFTPTVWERLSLFIQVTSNLAFHETRYIPIQKNKEVHNWLKVFLKKSPIPRKSLGKAVFTELVECLEESKEINPETLVFRLTGFQQIGLTSIQTANKLNMNPIHYHLEFINVLHYLIQILESGATRFPLLFSLLTDLEKKDALTLSARKTWGFLNQGFSIEQIAKLRNLKISTIEDHLVEFALNINEFSIDPYIDREVQREIIEVSRQEETRQLKVIRNRLHSVSYFQIRLVLAKYGDRQWI